MSNKDNTPNCDMREALVSYLYNEATPEEGRLVEAHLRECARCEQELAAFGSVRGLLQRWQVDDLPAIRVVAAGDQTPRRSALAVLRELFTVAPLWAKTLGAAAAAVFLLAVLGTEIKVGPDGFSMRADVLRRSKAVEPGLPAAAGGGEDAAQLTGAEVKAIVNQMIAESQSRQKEEMKTQLVGLESQLQTAHAADLAKITARIQEYRDRLKSLERDIDRREALDLTDILFSEVSKDAAGLPGMRTGNARTQDGGD
jgi:hypothetical protein